MPASVLSQVSAAAGVESAAGRLVGQAPLIGSDGNVIRNGQTPGIGINAAADPALRGFTVASGHLPGAPGQVAVDKATAADEHFRLGQPVKVVDHTGRIRAFQLAGTVDFGVNHEFGNATVTLFQTGTAFSVTGRPGYDLVVARAAPGTSQAALAATLRARPGMSGYRVQTGSQLATSEANAAVHFTQQFTTFILVFALIALIVACIVIYNTFTILITQRGRELALLRCVGASRGQVFREHPAGIGDHRAGRLGGRRAGRGRPRLGAAAAVRRARRGHPVRAGRAAAVGGGHRDGGRAGRHGRGGVASGPVGHPGRPGRRPRRPARAGPRAARSAGCGSPWPSSSPGPGSWPPSLAWGTSAGPPASWRSPPAVACASWPCSRSGR